MPEIRGSLRAPHIRRLHVLLADTETDAARAKPERQRRALQEPDGPRDPPGRGTIHASDHLFSHQRLDSLRDSRRKLAPALYSCEIIGANGAFSKRTSPYIGRRDGVLDGQI